MVYPKKFGFTRRKITPEAHNNANAIATPLIRSFHFLESHVVHRTQATMMTRKQTIRIMVISIFVSQAINVGKAFSSVTLSVVQFVWPNSIQFQINGTFVFSLTQQQTHGSEQGSQFDHTFLKPGSQVQVPIEVGVQGLDAKDKLDIDNITNQNNSANSFFVMIWFG